MAMHVRIATGLVDHLLALARAAPEREICGLLFGEVGRIDTAAAATNVAEDPTTGFEIDPATLIAAHRRARAGGPAIVGCFHSHPNGRAEPSPRDAAAAIPGDFWLILTVGQARLFHARPSGEFAPYVMASA